jgi:hypothetical protein
VGTGDGLLCRPIAGRQDDADFELFALNIDDVAMRAFTLASEVERNPRRTDPQVLNPERVQKRWQVRIDDGQLAAIGIGLQSPAGQ